MAPGLLVADVFTQVPPATMATARDGGNESKLLVFVYTQGLVLISGGNRTAEDLTATSRRLARYESLLNEILPMVSPEVRVLIEDARDNVSF